MQVEVEKLTKNMKRLDFNFWSRWKLIEIIFEIVRFRLFESASPSKKIGKKYE